MKISSYFNLHFKIKERNIIRKSNSIRLYAIIFFLIFILLSGASNIQVITPTFADIDQEILGSAPGRFNSIIADDIDDDGRCEIVFGNYEGFVTVLEYRGDDFYEEWRSPDIGQRVWGITVADFIGDSTKEIIVGNGDAEIYIYNAKTHKKIWDNEKLPRNQRELVRDIHGLLVHDLGMGGKPYLLAGTGYKTDNDLGTVFIFQENETNSEEIDLISKIGPFENRLRGLGVGDVDKDDMPEIIVGSGVATGEKPGEGYVRVFNIDSALNPGTLSSDTPIDPEWKSKNLKGCCAALELGDFTGDGYPDIVVANGYRYQAGWVRILTYDTNSKDFIEYWKSPNNPDIGPKPYGLAVGDIDDDKNLEIVVGNLAGYIYIFEQSGSTIELEWTSRLLGSDILGVDLEDVDNDGQIEIIAGQGGYTGKGDYTSGYTEPHIYIIDGRTHEIEITIGETNYFDISLQILTLILILFFLLGLGLYAKYHKRLKQLRPKQQGTKVKPYSNKGKNHKLNSTDHGDLLFDDYMKQR